MIPQADVDTDSIGNVVCRKVDDLKAAALVMASHSKSKLQVRQSRSRCMYLTVPRYARGLYCGVWTYLILTTSHEPLYTAHMFYSLPPFFFTCVESILASLHCQLFSQPTMYQTVRLCVIRLRLFLGLCSDLECVCSCPIESAPPGWTDVTVFF
jgi:hypothetical protein